MFLSSDAILPSEEISKMKHGKLIKKMHIALFFLTHALSDAAASQISTRPLWVRVICICITKSSVLIQFDLRNIYINVCENLFSGCWNRKAILFVEEASVSVC
jgi:hypothetical protein